jgi:hypothetical protein
MHAYEHLPTRLSYVAVSLSMQRHNSSRTIDVIAAKLHLAHFAGFVRCNVPESHTAPAGSDEVLQRLGARVQPVTAVQFLGVTIERRNACGCG